MTRGRALIRQFAQEQPIISHGNERRLGLGVLHARGKPKTFSGILSVFPGNHFSTSHTNGASACQCLQATINNPHSNQDAYEPSAVLIEHPRHPLQLYHKGIQTQATGHREPFAIPAEVAATASSAQRTACLRHSVGSPGASISRSRTKCSLLSSWRQRLGPVWFDATDRSGRLANQNFTRGRASLPEQRRWLTIVPTQDHRGWRRPRTGNRCHQHFGISRLANPRPFRQAIHQFGVVRCGRGTELRTGGRSGEKSSS